MPKGFVRCMKSIKCLTTQLHVEYRLICVSPFALISDDELFILYVCPKSCIWCIHVFPSRISVYYLGIILSFYYSLFCKFLSICIGQSPNTESRYNAGFFFCFFFGGWGFWNKHASSLVCSYWNTLLPKWIVVFPITHHIFQSLQRGLQFHINFPVRYLWSCKV